MVERTHFYRDVPKLGHVAVSRQAQARMDLESISPADFETKAQKDLAQWRAFLASQVRPKRVSRPPLNVNRHLWALQKGRCWLCGQPLDRRLVSRDHLHPISTGGKGKPHNILLAHRRCNLRRGNQGIYTRDEALAMLERRSMKASESVQSAGSSPAPIHAAAADGRRPITGSRTMTEKQPQITQLPKQPGALIVEIWGLPQGCQVLKLEPGQSLLGPEGSVLIQNDIHPEPNSTSE